MRSGFTLIELMVVVAIMMLSGTVLFVQFFNARDLADVETSAKRVESMLAQAQSFGRGGRAFSTSTDPTTDPERFDRGYGVFLQTDTSTVVLYGGNGTTSAQSRYDADNTVDIAQLENSRVTGLCVKVAGESDCTDEPGELHVLFRRGQIGVDIFGDSGDSTLYAFASATIEAGTYQKTVVMWSTGLVYTE
jgi:type II secretory pathway pseudopilin PulG